MERANNPDAKFDVVTFDLATGAKVRVSIDEYWEQLSESEIRLGQKPNLYLAMRVYSDENINPRRMVKHTEFRAGNDFDQSCLPRLWTWLIDLSVSRHRFSYDCLEDFLEEFSAKMDEFTVVAEDVADYLHKAHGIQPAYEDPPHAEFSEDELSPIRRLPDEVIDLEEAPEAIDDPNVGSAEFRIEREVTDESEQV